MKSLLLLIFIALLTQSAVSQDLPKREMRAVWIATVENIDWPTSPLLTGGCPEEGNDLLAGSGEGIQSEYSSVADQACCRCILSFQPRTLVAMADR